MPFVGILLYQTFASTTHGFINIFIENSLPLAFWYQTFSLICRWSYYEKYQFVDPKYTEKWYILLSVSTKIAIFWTSFSTFKRITEDNGVAAPIGIDWDMIRYMAFSLPASIVFLVAWQDAKQWKRK